MKTLAALSEECDVETDEIKNVSINKTATLINKIKDCKPFIGVSILFLSVSIILTGIMIYFKIKNIFLVYKNINNEDHQRIKKFRLEWLYF